MGATVPLSIKTLYSLLTISQDDFNLYVVCPLCDSVYEYKDCFRINHFGVKESKRCKFISNPDHPHLSRRVPCGAVLLKKVKIKSGYKLSPIKAYPYKPLRKSLEQLLKRKDFLQNCEKWRTRTVPDGLMCDIYDGAVWKKFSAEEQSFLSSPYCYLLTLNVDWFQPFERGVYSVGVIYLTIQNLPRDQRYRLENIIIVGILPGPNEPKKTMNSFLTPLVLELKECWQHGFSLMSYKNTPICVKAALSCITCDIPATRKVCGFLGHNATLGCNKCLKEYSKEGNSTNYAGYNREGWVERSFRQHINSVKEVLKEKTKTGQKAKESELGVRYSVLLDLPYFDPIEFIAVDTMHNLFLGTGKHVFEVWLEKNILTKQDLAEIGKWINKFHVPADLGRLPSSLSSSYGSFTANQWKHWITIYSCIILKNILTSEHYRCWQLFARSCMILCKYCLWEDDIKTADLLLLNFCHHFVRLYGESSCTFTSENNLLRFWPTTYIVVLSI